VTLACYAYRDFRKLDPAVSIGPLDYEARHDVAHTKFRDPHTLIASYAVARDARNTSGARPES
jgi:hypothetical protein